jgi:hypothetical protein
MTKGNREISDSLSILDDAPDQPATRFSKARALKNRP